MKTISSVQNPLIKQVVQLKEKSRARKTSGLFVLEGKRELSLALKGNYSLTSVFIYPDICPVNEIESLLDTTSPRPEIISISKEVYQKIAYRETTEGVLAIARSRGHSLDTISFKRKEPLILVAEAPEKPGNIGALLRTADAADVDAVIIANPKTDLYNPNIIRSSVGCVFTRTIAVGNTAEVIGFLKEKGININCAALTASVDYHTTDFTVPTAIVVGTEATGLSDEWLQHSDRNIIIPMQGEIDSMNVSVSAAILIFEAKRQRGFK
ncbi:TrmH family RNA methyltransferase [Sinomicrobium weinanense]|uniref:RNA methyltransferase n=1 Tax=Sinomicrobium weinanense TaxID=2842200 RepID=A0A926JQP7_9FLAO|nr:RNA methyltransferase [Sinomicrobium weinanense]MBC9795688.1 RNA methyltransferase [Sinomicrobium weinanense]MBU3122857.1 RNA methyltransferase [Sinomicrobium weinanense]